MRTDCSTSKSQLYFVSRGRAAGVPWKASLQRLVLVSFAFGAAACSPDPSASSTQPEATDSPEIPAAESPGTSRDEAAISEESATSGVTPWRIAVGNLNSRIDALRSALNENPDSSAVRHQLVDLLLARSQYLGSYDDFGEALELSKRGMDQGSGEAASMSYARALSAVHQFDQAEGLIRQTGEQDLGGALGTYAIATGGDPRPVEVARRERVRRHLSFESSSDWAIALMAVGEFAAADRAFADARANYRDVSPFPIAWIAFQRGVMWSEHAGRPDLGRAFYEEAVDALPIYGVANVHLAELEILDGEPKLAERRLRFLLDEGSTDPEPRDLLASILPDGTERTALIEGATERYYDLLEQYPLAFADHAAEFFMGSGADPAFAVSLAASNLEHRTNDRAYQVAIEAALAASDATSACNWARIAAEAPFPGFSRPSVPLGQLVARTLQDCR